MRQILSKVINEYTDGNKVRFSLDVYKIESKGQWLWVFKILEPLKNIFMKYYSYFKDWAVVQSVGELQELAR